MAVVWSESISHPGTRQFKTNQASPKKAIVPFSLHHESISVSVISKHILVQV